MIKKVDISEDMFSRQNKVALLFFRVTINGYYTCNTSWASFLAVITGIREAI
jgi:hypothetical protein